MSLEQNKAVLTRFVDFINTGKTAIADEVVALDFLERDPFPGQQTGREGLKAVILMLRAAFPDLEWVVDEMVAEGETEELRGFACSLKKDYEAVKAGLTLPWSQGVVEGHVHRLKLLKRQAYGRASFQTLRKRVLRCG